MTTQTRNDQIKLSRATSTEMWVWEFTITDGCDLMCYPLLLVAKACYSPLRTPILQDSLPLNTYFDVQLDENPPKTYQVGCL